MNIPYLLSMLKTEKLSELVANIDLPALDMNLAIWESIDRGEIEVDEEKDTVKLLVAAEPSSDSDLKNKILRVIQHYNRENTNVTRGRLNGLVKDALTGQGYPWHEYIMAIQHLIDGELVVQTVVEVPAEVKTTVKNTGKKKEKIVRPAHKFAFLCLTENVESSEEWNKKSVEKWIAEFKQASVK